MTTEPVASIIVVHYGSQVVLRNCLDSVVRNTGNVDVIVVDNDELPSDFATAFPEIHLIRSGRNLGFGAACNLGAAIAKSPFLVFMNNDILVEAGWLEPLLEAFDNRRVGIACPLVVLENERSVINSAGGVCDFMALAWNRSLGRLRNSSLVGDFFYAPGSCFAIRRDVFEEVGGFDGNIFLFLEDVDLSWRVRLSGWALTLVPSSVVLHKWMTSTSKLRSSDIQYLFGRNRLRLILKNYSPSRLVRILTIYLVLQLGLIGWVLARKRGLELRAVLAALLWNVRNLSDTFKARKRVQAVRSRSDNEVMGFMYRGIAGLHLALGTMKHPTFEAYFGRKQS